MKRFTLEDLILPAVALVAVVADQASKHWVRANLPPEQPVDLWPALAPIFSFTYTTNTGAAFGLFPGLGGALIVIAAVVVVAILFYNRSLPRGQWLVRLALGLQLGGAVGNNLIDRLRFGRVTDFIDLNFWPMQQWPVANLADISIVTGVCVLAFTVLLDTLAEQREKRSGGPGRPEPERDQTAA